MQNVEDFGIGHVGAFMFKHIRAKTNIEKYKEEFRCLRHGHYDELIERVQLLFPNIKMESNILAMLDANKGNEVITDKKLFTQKLQCDFVGIENSQEPMHHFSKVLVNTYGYITDKEYKTIVFQEVVLYELGLRNALSNQYILQGWDHNLITSSKMELTDVIDELVWIKEMKQEQLDLLHTGRQFRNYLKWGQLKKSKFKDSKDALKQFHQAIKLAQDLECALYNNKF